MKVTIEITKKGYSKTLIMPDGTKYIENWQNVGNGFQTTDDSVIWDDLNLTDDFKEAINDFNFSLGDLSNAIETESAELPYDDSDAITKDGHKLKRGDDFYSVAITANPWRYLPIKHKYPQDWDYCGDETYFSRENCVKVCERYNKANSKKNNQNGKSTETSK